MSVSAFGNVWNNLNSGIGSLWRPKPDRIRVGRDVGALTSTGFRGNTSPNTIIGQGDEVALKSREIFNAAASVSRNGYNVRQFRSVGDDVKSVFAGNTIYNKGDYTAVFSDGTLEIYKKSDDDPNLSMPVMKTDITNDTRVVWNEDGSPEILTGSEAYTNGTLKAQSANEIIFRKSGIDVEAGDGTVVYNLSSEKGTYTGGGNVTYFGVYEGGAFADTKGKVTFAGYFNDASFTNLTGISEFSGVFEEASVVLEEGHSIFSGYFSASDITGASAGNRMSGMFLNACTVRGNDGDDVFNGRFIDSEVDGGEGNNSFGYGASTQKLAFTRTLNEKVVSDEYYGITADFVNANVNAGKGTDRFNGVMWGGILNLGDGDDSAEGIFSQAEINGGNGNDNLSATYTRDTVFNTGAGNDTVNLTTAVMNSVNTGEGTNSVTLGQNDATPASPTWQTVDEYFNNTRPTETGELVTNTVNAAEGDNTVSTQNGETTKNVHTRDIYQDDGDEFSFNQEHRSDDTLESLHPALLEDPAIFLNLTDIHGNEHDGNDKVMRKAVSRYLQIYGEEPQSKGSVAAFVDTGHRNIDTFYGIERKDDRRDSEPVGMVRTILRPGADGSYTWSRWQGIQD